MEIPAEGEAVWYWLNHSLPIYVLLVDLDTMAMYWQEISEQRCRPGRGAVSSSRYRRLMSSRRLASHGRPPPRSSPALRPRTTRTTLGPGTLHRRHHPGLAAVTRDGYASLLCAHLARGRHAPELTAQYAARRHAALAGGPGSGRLRRAGRLRRTRTPRMTWQSEVLLGRGHPFSSRELRFTISAGMIALILTAIRPGNCWSPPGNVV